MRKKIVLFVTIALFMLLMASCTHYNVSVTGTAYVADLSDVTNSELYQPLKNKSLYYKGEELGHTNLEGEFDFKVDVMKDATYFFNQIYIGDENYKVDHVTETNIGKRDFFITIVTVLNLDETGKDSEDKDRISTIRILEDDEIESDSMRIEGHVIDLSYNRVKTTLTFGKETDYAVETDEQGCFSFYYIDYNGYEIERMVDFLYPDIQRYRFKTAVKEKWFGRLYCVIFVTDIDSTIDFNTVVPNVFIRCSFDQSGVVLPAGYPSQEKELDQQTYSVEGASTMSGVKLYIDGKFVMESDITGFVLDFLIIGAELKLEAEGFTFKLRKGSSQPLEIENNTYIFDPYDGFLEFRGATDDEEILLKTFTP